MRYPGGKGKTFPRIINCMPPHRVYIETHLGGGSVMRNKRRADLTIGIDLDPIVLREREADLDPSCQLICADATQWLRQHRFSGDELVYCDPPYLPSTRRKGRLYRCEMSEEQHVDLLDALGGLPCKVMLSGYASTLYQQALRHWPTVEFPSKTHAGLRTETLWMNFDPPNCLHDYSNLGSSFREREAIKRRLNSLKSRIDSLPALERASLAAWMAQGAV